MNNMQVYIVKKDGHSLQPDATVAYNLIPYFLQNILTVSPS